MNATNTPDHTTPYHYVLTIRRPDSVVRTHQGTVDIHPGETRQSIFDELMDRMAETHGQPLAVLYHSLEPNQL
ncbi:hypothetical protein [Streptomyces sp. NPDC059076]|uniref:hypothetical protein n=1 Tax=unclassified Streptomyces TaxID=2593676 RepID=UPI0036B0D4F4